MMQAKRGGMRVHGTRYDTRNHDRSDNNLKVYFDRYIYNSMGFSAVPVRWTVLDWETMEEVAAMSTGSFIVVRWSMRV